MDAQDTLAEGDLTETLKQLQQSIRSDPANSQYRIFLFQLLVVMGQWDRALTQLNVISEMDDSALAMVQTYRQALVCEGYRSDVFAGKRTPVIFGKPDQWMALLVEALRLSTEGQHEKAQDIRDQAFELAPATAGTIGEADGEAFEWIADADTRLGPMLEVICNNRYYWIPFNRIRTIKIEKPDDLRDRVWTPAYFTWANGGEMAGLIPTRYPGSENSEDDQVVSAGKTIWTEVKDGVYHGLGQRMITTDAGDYSLMDLRQINLLSEDDDTDIGQIPEMSTQVGLSTDKNA